MGQGCCADTSLFDSRSARPAVWARVRAAIGIGMLLSLLVLPPVLLVSPAPSFAEDLEGEPDPFFDDLFDEEFDDDLAGYADPLERSNRGIFAFNRQVDKWILDPVTKAYRWAVPKPARSALARMFANLGSTKTLVNDFLQLEWKDAGITGTRLVVNTTIGIVGLFDVAKSMGMAGHESDFGQTLALAGTPSGPYLVLPVLGPSNVRDGVGTVVDGFFQPTYYLIGPSNLLFGPTEILLYSGTSGISTRERFYREIKALEESSVDFYAALRSGFYQRRVDEIWGRRSGHRTVEEPGSRATEDEYSDIEFEDESNDADGEPLAADPDPDPKQE
jgi:phospholipid-binding lipoprotein MlaA